MKVLNLQCSQRHRFEGWFASEGDFQSQLTRRLVECPLCADADVSKLPSAPRLNFGASSTRGENAAEKNGPAALSESGEPAPQSLEIRTSSRAVTKTESSTAEQAALLTAIRHVLANTEDVGGRFADESRAMHYGDAQIRNIRGQASVAEVRELLEEGIEVMSLPVPAALKETLQ